MTDKAAQLGEPADGAKSVEVLQTELASAKAGLESLRFQVSHDLRAPLRHIRAFVQVIEEDHAHVLNPPVLGHLKTIKQSADQAMQMLDGLLETRKRG
jgi:light-regulated signal transduction histidine kinase (bacteriophytochrome)